MKQKTISLLLALALALSLAGCKKEETVTAPAGVAVQVQTFEAQDIASENTVSGQVTAGSETSVYVTATAKCTAVYVEAGDAVKAGDVICSLDMESSLAQYRAAAENGRETAARLMRVELQRPEGHPRPSGRPVRKKLERHQGAFRDRCSLPVGGRPDGAAIPLHQGAARFHARPA